MRLLSQLLVVLIVCLIAIALPSVPAQAQCGAPFIELSPNWGVPGTEVIINGQRFDAGKYVDIYYDGTIIATGRTDIRGNLKITFTVPEGYKGAYLVHAKVGADLGYDTADAHFTVKPGLTVSPEKGPVGTNVTVKGQGFAQNEEGIQLIYYLNGNYEMIDRHIMANAKGSWQISFPIPLSTKGEHNLDAEGAVSRLYEVIDAIFGVTLELSIDKSSGSVGDTITMTGSRFAAYENGIKILFDGQAVVTDISADAQGDWESSFEVPEMPTDTYSVTAEGEQTRKEDIIELSFEIKPDILLSPNEGHVGIDLTITGQGFAANKDVVITYDGGQVATAETNDQGSFDVSFAAPESQHGEHQVTSGYSAENAASAIFTMESDPPSIPALISPSNGCRLGFIGKVTPTFEWSAVSDDSGVHYSLQIATSDDFAASSVIVSVTDLTEASYTLTEALPDRTYYWIVQAVDGAENESGWTADSSFRVGLLPMWAFIVSIVAIVVLIIALVYFFLRRRITYYYD